MLREQILKKIDDYVAGKLTTREIEDLWVEMMKDPEYLRHLETLINTKSLIESRSSVSRQNKTGGKFWRIYGIWFGAAAALLIIVAALNFFKLNSNEVKIDTVYRISNSALESPVVLRSVGNKMTMTDSLLNAGYLKAINGNDEEAIQEFSLLIDQFPESQDVPKAEFNIGVIRYNKGNYKMAELAFNNALINLNRDSILKEKTLWYLGNTYIKLNNFEMARYTLKKVYAMNGIYMSKALALLRQIDSKLAFKNNKTDQ